MQIFVTVDIVSYHCSTLVKPNGIYQTFHEPKSTTTKVRTWQSLTFVVVLKLKTRARMGQMSFYFEYGIVGTAVKHVAVLEPAEKELTLAFEGDFL